MNAPLDFDAHLATLQLDEKTLAGALDETIVPERLRNERVLDAVRTLPRLEARPRDTPGEQMVDLEVLGTLGEGGMGLVKLARQVALDRDVAVKTMRQRNDQDAPQLLKEAYITGRLEHPNIVPVYTLGRDDGGIPLIVMKWIDGVSWLDVLDDPTRAPDGVVADVYWHLDILLQVCNALRYAHQHHVIHRDIKPENIMIGSFGEVYLLDWGISVSIADDEADRSLLPHRKDASGLAGTPVYLAPEMTRDDASEQDHRTDVYLLGATLCHVLTGKPPHDGATLFDVLRAAHENHPVSYPEEVPRELAAIARRAMATAKEDRFESIEDFRRAVSHFLEHRGALDLLAQAERLLAQIDAVRQSGRDAEEAAFQVHDLFTQARFACEQALRSWPQSEEGREIFERLLRRQVLYVVDRHDLVQAHGLIAQMVDLGMHTDDLLPLVEQLRADRDSERAELQGLRALAAELDLSQGRISRSMAVVFMGVMWSANTLVVWWREDPTLPPSASAHLNSTIGAVTIGVIAFVAFRKQLFYSTIANRRLAIGVGVALATLVAFRIIFWLQPIEVTAARAYEAGLFGAAAVIMGLILDDLRISLIAALYLPVAISFAVLGSTANLLVAALHFLLFLGVGYFWTPHQLEKRWKL